MRTWQRLERTEISGTNHGYDASMTDTNVSARDDDEEDENPQEIAAALIQMLDADVERIIARYDKLLETMFANGVTREQYQEYDGERESLSREIFRAFFAYVEGTVFSLKQYAMIQLGLLDQPLEPCEVDAVLECTWRMRDNGVVEYKPANITFMQNLLFMVRLQERLHGLEKQLDRNSIWFRCLAGSVHVRDRVMHPKHPSDLEVDVEDLKTLWLARTGFIALLEKFMGPRPWKLPDVWLHRPERMPEDMRLDVRKALGLDPGGTDWPGWPGRGN